MAPAVGKDWVVVHDRLGAHTNFLPPRQGLNLITTAVPNVISHTGFATIAEPFLITRYSYTRVLKSVRKKRKTGHLTGVGGGSSVHRLPEAVRHHRLTCLPLRVGEMRCGHACMHAFGSSIRSFAQACVCV